MQTVKIGATLYLKAILIKREKTFCSLFFKRSILSSVDIVILILRKRNSFSFYKLLRILFFASLLYILLIRNFFTVPNLIKTTHLTFLCLLQHPQIFQLNYNSGKKIKTVIFFNDLKLI